MRIAINLLFGTIVTAFLGANYGFAGSLGTAPGSAQMIVTVQPARGIAAPDHLEADDLSVLVGNTPARVLRAEHLAGGVAPAQLFILVDDSLRSSSFGVQLPELKAFVRSLPANTEVAVGYMRNGSAAFSQGFTTDHEEAAAALRLPIAQPGENGSPYFALSDLAKHWPSKEAATQSSGRRVVLMLTDGVDRYYDNSTVNDPYVEDAVHSALKQGILVYSIYLRDAGLYDRGSRTTLFAQSRLDQVSQETGGYAYFQDFSDPVSIAPFLSDFLDRLDHQFRITVQTSGKGLQPVQVRSELHGVKIQGPTRLYVE